MGKEFPVINIYTSYMVFRVLMTMVQPGKYMVSKCCLMLCANERVNVINKSLNLTVKLNTLTFTNIQEHVVADSSEHERACFYFFL